MAKKATGKSGTKSGGKASGKARAKSGTQVARVSSSSGGSGGSGSKSNGFDASEAFVKLLQSPLMAELVAVGSRVVVTQGI